MTLRRGRPYWAKKKAGGSGLDQTGMTGFYSFRRLSGYSGFCVRVSRASDSAILDVGFTGDYVNESAMNTFFSGTSGFINRIYNQINTDEYLDITSGNCTIYQAGSFFKIGSFLSPRLFGSTALSFYSISGAGYITKTIKSSFIALQRANARTINYYCWGASSNNGLFYGGTFSGVNGHGSVVGGSVIVSNTTEDFNFHLQTFINSSGHYVWTDSSDPAFSASSTADLIIAEMGRSSGTLLSMDGNFVEWAFYNTDKTSNRTDIEDDVNNYYSIY